MSRARFAVAAAVSTISLCGCGGQGAAVRFGALIPLTGSLADSGPQIEQAFLLAGDRINAAGGIAGKPINIQVQDTHSDPARGFGLAQQLAEDDTLLGLVGPEEDDIARNLIQTIRQKQLPEISGGVISTTFSVIADDGLFFRTDPSGEILGKALAQRMRDDGINRAAVLFVSNEYGRSFSGVLANDFSESGGVVVAPGTGFQGPISVTQGAASYRDVLQGVVNQNVDAIVLVTPPETGAALVRDWSLLASPGRLYFAPSLRSDSFLESMPTGAADGMVGVAPALPDDRAAFADAFGKQFYGNQPRPEAYFYYDALALLAFATEAASVEVGGVPSRDKVKEYLPKVAGPPGEPVRWNELEKGLKLIRAGTDIDYQGASGSVDWNGVGDAPGKAEFWSIQSNQVVAQ